MRLTRLYLHLWTSLLIVGLEKFIESHTDYVEVVSVMKKLVVFIVAATITLVVVVVSTGQWYEQQQNCLDHGAASQADVSDTPGLLGGGAIIEGVALGEENIKRAIQIARIVRSEGMPYRAAMAALIGSWQESLFMNPGPADSDRDSAGPFQQRPNWGPLKFRMQYRKATKYFLFGGDYLQDGYSEPGLTDIRDWQTRPLGEVVQAVQVSAFPDRYDDHIDGARRILAHIGWEPDDNEPIITAAGGIDCTQVDPAEQAVLAARSRVGDPYTWQKPVDGASFSTAMYSEAGIELPDTIDDQAGLETSADSGVQGSWVTDPAELQRGDLVFTGQPGASSDPKNAKTVSLFVGDEMPSTSGGVPIGTFNIRGSQHTPSRGAMSAANRIKKSASLIGSNDLVVVGLQEVQPDQRADLLRILDNQYKIWPTTPPGLDGQQWPNSQNPILWDPARAKAVEFQSLPMPKYFGHRDRWIPAIKFQLVDSGAEFWVINTHDPAKRQYARLRLMAAEARASQANDLAASGASVIVLGDFNSGYDLRGGSRGNVTYGNLRSNLTRCKITESGVMVDSYERARVGCTQDSPHPIGIGIVDHVFVSEDVRVTNHTVIKDGTGSDHPLVYANLLFPGMVTDVATAPSDSLGVVVGPDDRGELIALSYLRPASFVGAIHLTFGQAATLSYDGEVAFPVPSGSYADSNNYGLTGPAWSAYHTGNDYSAPCGTPVYAATTGTINVLTDQDWAGNWLVKVETEPGGLTTWYAHMQRMYAFDGETVTAGQQIGEVGDLGNSFGCHLHFEVHPKDGGYADDDIDPHDWFAAHQF